MQQIECTIIRGGSSKGIYIERDALPVHSTEKDAAVLKLFGSPDLRQIDGLGGADKLTSKVAVMGAASRSDCDIDYHFGQVNIALPRIDWTSNCGNLAAGAAIYAVYNGYSKSIASDLASVRIHQVNTGRAIEARVPLENGVPAVQGNYSIGGVPGSGAMIELDYSDFAGCTLQKGVFPTGSRTDTIKTEDGRFKVSVVDFGNVCVFVDIRSTSIDASRSLADLQGDQRVVEYLERIRRAVAIDLGLLTKENADEESRVRMNPLLFIIGGPADYKVINGNIISKSAFDLGAISITRREFSKAYPGTGSLATAVAAKLATTTVNDVLPEKYRIEQPPILRIGHPSGVMEISASVHDRRGYPVVNSVVLGRTARLLMKGTAYIR